MSIVEEHDVFFVPSQFSTIGEAVGAVVRPTTIMVSPGVYAEDIRIAGKQSLVIQSTCLSRRGVTLVGGEAESVMDIEGSVVHLSGIEIRSLGHARGISAADASISLQECVLAGNRVGERAGEPFGAGMFCRSSSVRIQKSTIAGNIIERTGNAGGGGLHLVDCRVEIAGSSIQTNAVYASGEARGGGLWCERSRLRMWRSRVTDNALYSVASEGTGVYFRNAVAAQIGGSVITGNGSPQGVGGGVYISGNPEAVVVQRNSVVRQNYPVDLQVE